MNDFFNYHGLLNICQGYLLNTNYDKLIRNADGTFDINKFCNYANLKNKVYIAGNGLHNTFGLIASETPIGAVGWFIGSTIGEKLTTYELYNRILFGKDSPTYRSRVFNWFKSKILEE